MVATTTSSWRHKPSTLPKVHKFSHSGLQKTDKNIVRHGIGHYFLIITISDFERKLQSLIKLCQF